MASTIAFLAVATLVESLIVVYAMALGVKDIGVLTVRWPVTFTISPLFHLIPIAVIITLLFSWMYLARKLSVRPVQPTGRAETFARKKPEKKPPMPKAGQPSKSSAEKTQLSPPAMRGPTHLGERIRSAGRPIRSALTVLLAFLALALIVSLLAYPGLIYQALIGSYQNHSSLYNFVASVANSLRGFARAVSPIGWIAGAINNGLVAISPSIRNIGDALGSLVGPLANLDPEGKYLAFQNAAMWISAILILFYGQYARRSYRYRKK